MGIKYFNTKAVSAAFMAFRKTTFKLNGMNEYIFPLTFNDVHLSLKLMKMTYKMFALQIYKQFTKVGQQGIQYQLMPLSK